jgi:hypothetical protein
MRGNAIGNIQGLVQMMQNVFQGFDAGHMSPTFGLEVLSIGINEFALCCMVSRRRTTEASKSVQEFPINLGRTKQMMGLRIKAMSKRRKALGNLFFHPRLYPRGSKISEGGPIAIPSPPS